MGSFSSKVRSIRYGVAQREDESNEELNSGTERETRQSANTGDMTENSPANGQADTANGDVPNTSTATNSEQQVAPKVGQSFSWLASTPVVLNTTTKDQKTKGKRPMEGRKTSPVMKYSNEKYLKSWQQGSGESSSCSSKGNTQSSSASAANDYGASKEEKDVKKGNTSDSSLSGRPGNFPVGFGVVGKQSSPNPAGPSRLTVRTSLKQTLSLESKEDGTSLPQSP